MVDFNTEDIDKLKISELKRIAEYWYRKHILNISLKNGRGKYFCPLKKKWYKEKDMQVAHFIDRNNLETAFEVDNTWLISSQSNMWDAKIPKEGYKSLHHYEYEMFLREKIGDKKVDELLHRKKNYTIFARDLYKKIIDEYRK